MRGAAEPRDEAADAAGAEEFGESLIKTRRIYKWFGGGFYFFGKMKMIAQFGLC